MGDFKMQKKSFYKYTLSALLSLGMVISMSGCNNGREVKTYQSGYEEGYDAGYKEGIKSYQSGYDDGYDAGYQEGEKILPDKNAAVKVYGDFTATVRELIPDYVYDSETPRAAVITLFQSGPVVLNLNGLNEEAFEKIEAGETYTFIVEEQEACLLYGEFDDDGNVDSTSLAGGRIWVNDFREPAEEEYGLNCWRVYCDAE